MADHPAPIHRHRRRRPPAPATASRSAVDPSSACDGAEVDARASDHEICLSAPGGLPSTRLTVQPLPRQLTRLVGREHDLEELARLLRSAPLLTLTGAAGV